MCEAPCDAELTDAVQLCCALGADAIVVVSTQAMAEGMLGDGKLEVAGVAAATLSGMLKVAPPAEAAATRARFLDAATAATSSRKQARRRGASSAGAKRPLQIPHAGCATPSHDAVGLHWVHESTPLFWVNLHSHVMGGQTAASVMLTLY